MILRVRQDDGCEYSDILKAFLAFSGYTNGSDDEIRKHTMHIEPGKEGGRSYHITLDLNRDLASGDKLHNLEHAFFRGREVDCKWYFTRSRSLLF